MLEKTIAWIDRLFTAIERIIHAAIKVSVIALIAIVAYLLFRGGDKIISHFEKPALVNQISPPKDTATVKAIQPITINNITYPAKVEKQEKPDTALRKEVEKGTIVTGEKLEDGKLEVQKIDSAGNKIQSEFAVKPTDKIEIDKTGNVSVEEDKKAEAKEKLRKTVNKILIGGTFGAGFILGRASK